jgi:HAD superfamily hydrolase (TIGR01484 family)
MPSIRQPKNATRFLLLATDYDGTLASQGHVDDNVLAALRRVLASGRKLVLVTGRHLPDLKTVFPHLELFHRVIVENGALLYRPDRNEEVLLCEPPPDAFLERLRERKIPFVAGRGVVATWQQYEPAVRSAIGKSGLDLEIALNKDAVMILPRGVNKGTGLKTALDELGVSPQKVIGFGDAENDPAFLALCGCAVAVANALPAVKAQADIVTTASHGPGVVEVIDQLLRDELAEFCSGRQRPSSADLRPS